MTQFRRLLPFLLIIVPSLCASKASHYQGSQRFTIAVHSKQQECFFTGCGGGQKSGGQHYINCEPGFKAVDHFRLKSELNGSKHAKAKDHFGGINEEVCAPKKMATLCCRNLKP